MGLLLIMELVPGLAMVMVTVVAMVRTQKSGPVPRPVLMPVSWLRLETELGPGLGPRPVLMLLLNLKMGLWAGPVVMKMLLQELKPGLGPRPVLRMALLLELEMGPRPG